MKNKGDILAGYLAEYNNCIFFLHNTKEVEIAEKIMREGFMFESQLPHSTDRVNPNEPIEVSYFLFQRKDYGNYTIVIAIPKETYHQYLSISNENDTGIEEVVTITEPRLGENDEYIYTFPPEHMLGYFNIRSAEFIKNNNWDPLYNKYNDPRGDLKSKKPEE